MKTRQNVNVNKTKKNHVEQKHKCARCPYSAKYRYSLSIHMKTHPDVKLLGHSKSDKKERPFKCPEPNCEYAAAQKQTLKEHRVIQHPQEGEELPLFSCPVDGCPFTTKHKTYVRHHLVAHSDSFFTCSSCPFQTRWKEALKKHRRRIHNENPDPDPDPDGENGENPNSRPFKCPEANCTYAAKFKCDLKRHTLIHTSALSFKCPVDGCSYAGRTRAYLTKHENVHTRVKNFACALCSKTFAEPKTLKCHISYIHTKERPLKCQVDGCTFSAVLQSALKAHDVVHSDDRRFPCEFKGCSYMSKQLYVLRRHLSAVHGDNSRPFKCLVLNCPYAAKTKSRLYAHKKQVHSNEWPFKCPEADAETGSGCSFAGAKTLANLRRHMATHQTTKSLECPEPNCKFKTNHPANLQKHFQMQHTEMPEIKCPLCKYATKYKGNLSGHIKRHARKKAIKCDGSDSE